MQLAVTYTSVLMSKFICGCLIDFCCQKFHRLLWLVYVLSLPEADLRHHLETWCLDIASFAMHFYKLPMNIVCRKFPCPQKAYNLADSLVRPVLQVFKFKVFNGRSCVPAADITRTTWKWTTEPFVFYVNRIWNVKNSVYFPCNCITYVNFNSKIKNTFICWLMFRIVRS